MYHNFFALKHDPFTGALDAESLFLSPSRQAVLQAIMHGIRERQGLMAVVGEVGVGKTTLLRSALEHLTQVKTLYIPYPHLSFQSILQIMQREFGCQARSDNPVDMLHCLRQVLLEEYHKGCNVVLMLDEAQNVPVRTLQQLLLLAELESPAGKLVQIVLVGQPAFEEKLKLPGLQLFTAQLARRLTLSPLTTKESIACIQRRLAKAVTQDEPIFTPKALRLIAQSARGNCRILHALCINAFITGAMYQQKPISAKVALEVIAQYMGKKPLPLTQWGMVSAAALLLCTSLLGGVRYGYPLIFHRGPLELASLPQPVASTLRSDTEDRAASATSPGAQYQPAVPPLLPTAGPVRPVMAALPPLLEPLPLKPLWQPMPAAAQPAVRATIVASVPEAPALATAAPVVPPQPIPVLKSPLTSEVQKDVPQQVPSTPTERTAAVPLPQTAVGQKKPKAVGPSPLATSEPLAVAPSSPPAPTSGEPKTHAAAVTPKRKTAAPARPVEAAHGPMPSQVGGPGLPHRAPEAEEKITEIGKAPPPDRAHTAAVPPPGLGAEPALLDGASRLVIESGGHTAIIRQLLFTADGRRMVSVSDDKTIRVWAVTPDGRKASLSRTIRGQLGDGRAGMLAAAALSPPDATGRQQWLAVGGLLAGALPDCYAVRLHDFASGEVVALLPGHTDAVLALAFAPTGRWLASAGKDGTVRLWDLESLQGSHLATAPVLLTGHTDHVYDLAWSPTGDRLASASYDHTVGLWNTAQLGQGTVPSLGRLRGHAHQVQTVAFHPHGAVLASGGKDRTVRLWRAQDGATLGMLAQATHHVAALAFAPDGRGVLTGSGAPPKPDRLTLFAYPSGEIQHVFTGHQNAVLAVAFHPSGQWAASGGGEQKEILLWHTATGEVLSRLEGRGRTIYAVGFSSDGQYLSWGYTSGYKSPNQRGPLEHRFDLTQLVRLPGGLPAATAIQAQERVGDLWLATEPGGASDHPSRLHVHHGQRRLGTIALGPADGYRHSAYTLTPDGQGILSGGANGVLRLYALDGTLRATLVGHTGEIKAVAVSADQQWAVSGASDQTVRLWSLAALPKSGSLELAPTLTLFPTIDGEWAAWTPKGFFTASAHGAQLLGYSLNQGLDKVAQYIPAEQVRARLYRPELILAKLSDDLHQQPYRGLVAQPLGKVD